MADRYIDYEETQVYGPHASQKIRALALELVPSYDAALKYIADELDAANAGMAKALGGARPAEVIGRSVGKKKEPPLPQALALIGRFSSHLDSHVPGTVSRKDFLPSEVRESISRSAPRVLLTLSHIAEELAKPDCPVRDAKSWHDEFAAAAAALSPAMERSDKAHSQEREITPALEQARSAWPQVYVAAKCTVEAVLRLTGKLHLMTVIFYDLAVPDAAKVTAPPAAPSAPIAAPAAPSKIKKPRRTR
jgi:hypothetical protein